MNKNAKTVADVEIRKTKNKDILLVDPRNVKINPSNVRTEYGDITELAESIVEIGLQQPLKAKRIRGTEEFILVDGHRRHTAIMHAIESLGADIPYVEVQVFTGNSEDEILTMLVTGSGQKPLTDVEMAEGVKRLIAANYTAGQIAKKIAKSPQYVVNMAALANVPKAVKDKISEGLISGNTVVQIVREAKDETKVTQMVNDTIKNAQKESETSGKKVVARAKHVTSLKGKSEGQKLKELVQYLDENKISNKKTEILAELVARLKDDSVEELATLFKK